MALARHIEDNESMRALHTIEVRALLVGLLSGEGGFHGAAAVLEGLSTEQALSKPHDLPHSIAEIVAHMCYWQEWFSQCAAEGFTGVAEHAAEGWPAVAPDGWEALRARYLHAIEVAKQIAATSRTLGDPLIPPGVPIPFFAKESKGSGILHPVVHIRTRTRPMTSALPRVRRPPSPACAWRARTERYLPHKYILDTNCFIDASRDPRACETSLPFVRRSLPASICVPWWEPNCGTGPRTPANGAPSQTTGWPHLSTVRAS